MGAIAQSIDQAPRLRTECIAESRETYFETLRRAAVKGFANRPLPAI